MAESIKSRAYIEGVNQSPRKVALVASLVHGRTVADALVILNHTPKRAAKPVIKAIESVKANAINNDGADAKTLVIANLVVSTGTRLRRYVPASRGRALPFEKKTSNILVEVTGEVKPKKAPVKKSAESTATKTKTETKGENK